MKFGKSIFKTFFLSLCIIANTSFAYAQTASILPPAKTTFFDQNGNPLTSGTVDFYVPGTTTRKTTWQDSGETVPNTNPVVLDSAGRAIVLGDGAYRQIVKDRNGNLIWDQVTSSISSGGSGGSTIGDGLPVGSILPTSAIIAPANYQFAYGQALSRSTYSALLAAITIQTSVGCVGGSPIINVADTTSLSVGTVLESICVSGSPTIVSKTSSTVTLSVNAVVTISTTGRFFLYGNGDGLTTFNVPDFRGYVAAGRCNMGGVDCANLNSTYFSSNVNNTPSSLNAKGGNQSKTLVAANLPPQTPAGTVSGSVTSITNHIKTGSFGGTDQAGFAVIGNTAGTTLPDSNSFFASGTISASFTGTAFAGQTSTAFALLQPTLTLNYAIKVTPDVNLTSTYGVAAIGGMTGIIACGSGVICAGNTISAISAGVNSIQGMSGNITCGLGLSCSANTINANAITYLTPDQYGAVCDGVTNDAAALQAAVTAAAGKGLFIPSGKTCVTNAVLTVSSNTVITGAGRDVSSIKSTISNRGAIFYMANASNITISDLYLQGTRSVTSWSLPSFGAIDVEQDNSAASDLGNFTFKNLKLTGFNSTYWIQLSIGNSNFSMNNVVIDNLLITTATADIPSDGTASNNVNYAIVMYGGANGQGIRNSSIRNVTIEGAALCFGVGLYQTHYKFNVINNKILNIGNTNVAAHCTNGLGFTNAYGIFVYDISGAGFPSSDGIISGNYISFPYSNGIYMVGAANATLPYNDFNTTISGNEIVGQSQTDLPIRGAIALNNFTNSLITGNTLYNNWSGIVTSGQYIGQTTVSSNMCTTNVSGGTCWALGGASGTTGNVPVHNVKNNTFTTSGTSSATTKMTSDSSHYVGSINFTDNTINAAVTGVTFAGLFANGNLTITGNNFAGVSATPLTIAGATLGSVTLLSNTGAPFTFATLPTATNGSSVFVSDADPATGPCTSAGAKTGSTAFRQNNAWKCF